MAFLLLLHPALGHVFALLGVLRVTSLLVLSAADLRIFSGTLLGRLSVASLSWLIPTLLRVLGLALLVVLLMALLGKLIFKYCLRKIYRRRRKVNLLMLCVALLPVGRLAQFLILRFTLGR